MTEPDRLDQGPELTRIKHFALKFAGASKAMGLVDWHRRPTDRQVIHKLLQKLGNRRMLSHYHGGFEYVSVIKSCEAIRDYLTDALCELAVNSGLGLILDEARTQVHLFQSLVEERYPTERYRWDSDSAAAGFNEGVSEALTKLQVSFGQAIEELSEAFDIRLFGAENWLTGFEVDPALK